MVYSYYYGIKVLTFILFLSLFMYLIYYRRYRQWLATEWAIARTEGKELRVPAWFWPESLSRASGQLLVRLLHHDPHMRLSAEDVLSQSWCRGGSGTDTNMMHTGRHGRAGTTSRVLFPADDAENTVGQSVPRINSRGGKGSVTHNGTVSSVVLSAPSQPSDHSSSHRSASQHGLQVNSALPDAVCVDSDSETESRVISILADQVRRCSFDEVHAVTNEAGTGNTAVPVLSTAPAAASQNRHRGVCGEVGAEYIRLVEQQRQKEQQSVQDSSDGFQI